MKRLGNLFFVPGGYVFNEEIISIDRFIKNGTVQCIIVDPPYGLDKKHRDDDKLSYDDSKVGFSGDWFNILYKKLTPSGTLFITINDDSLYHLVPQLPIPWYEKITWDKRGSLSWSGLRPRKNTVNMRTEVILGFPKNVDEREWHPDWKTSIFHMLSNGVGNIKWHPSPKPVSLYKRLIGAVCTPNSDQRVLDPAAGSGTAAVAARSLGLTYIMVEKNKEYVDEMIKRLSHEVDPYFPGESYTTQQRPLF